MIAFLLITLIIATCRICSLGDKRFSRRLILIVRFRAYMKRTDFIFAFASAVTLSIRYYAIDWSSNISSNLARNVCIVVNGQFVFCKFLFLALLLNVCNTLVKYHVFPKPNINRLVCSVWVRNIVDSSSFLTVTRKFGVTFVDHGFDFLKIFEFPSRTTSSATFRSTFFMRNSVCIDELICFIPSHLSLNFGCRIKLSSLISGSFGKHWLEIIS